MNITEILKSESQKTSEMLLSASNEIKSTLEPYLETLEEECYLSIPKEFSQFLYGAMGDSVNSTRKSIINHEYIRHNFPSFADYSDEKITQLLIQNHIDTMRRSYTKPEPNTAYITVGKDFGVSHHSGDTGRIHTLYFDEDEIFQYLIDEHIGLVSNKEKRECVSEFVGFRNDFMTQYEKLNDVIIPVDIPIKVGRLNRITNGDKFYSYNKEEYILLDYIIDSKITHIYAKIGNINTWNKTNDVNRNVRRSGFNCADNKTVISLTLLNVTTNSDNMNNIHILGNIDLGKAEKNIRESLYGLSKTLMSSSNIVNYHPSIGSPSSCILKHFENASIKNPYGVIIDPLSVLTHHQFKKELDSRVNFYKNMSTKLLEVKHNNAPLYFVNGDI